MHHSLEDDDVLHSMQSTFVLQVGNNTYLVFSFCYVCVEEGGGGMFPSISYRFVAGNIVGNTSSPK